PELAGPRRPAAPRAAPPASARGPLTAAELGERVRRRYNIQ
ncbi:hypothetical protein, partial [Mycobacterium canetti]